MRVCLTNDDGYDAPGLAALYDAVRRIGDVEVDVVAPAEAHSGGGHRVSRQVRFWTACTERLGEVTVVEGTPADCVRVAIGAPGRRRPDWILSGINHGGNLGVDVYYSGTVAAAREAAIVGIPAAAVSQVVQAPDADDWERSAREAAAVLAALLRPGAPPPAGVDAGLHEQACAAIRLADGSDGAGCSQPALWNVNLPRLAAGEPVRGVALARVSTDPLEMLFEHDAFEDGSCGLRYVGRYQARPASPGTDVSAAFGGQIAISRVPI